MQLRKRHIYRALSFIPALLILCFIYTMSDSEGDESGSMSQCISQHLMAFFVPMFQVDATDADILNYAQQAEWYVRKLAHMTEFFCLTAALLLPVEVYEGRLSRRAFVAVYIIALSMAALDEYHQTFIAGRVGTPYDILIDGIGVSFAMLVAVVLHIISSRRKRKMQLAKVASE